MHSALSITFLNVSALSLLVLDAHEYVKDMSENDIETAFKLLLVYKNYMGLILLSKPVKLRRKNTNI